MADQISPAAKKEVDAFAQKLQGYEAQVHMQQSIDHVSEAKWAAQKFLDDVFKMPKEDQQKALLLAQKETEMTRAKNSDSPGINVVLSHKTGELAEFQLVYTHKTRSSASNEAHYVEVIDLYKP